MGAEADELAGLSQFGSGKIDLYWLGSGGRVYQLQVETLLRRVMRDGVEELGVGGVEAGAFEL